MTRRYKTEIERIERTTESGFHSVSFGERQLNLSMQSMY